MSSTQIYFHTCPAFGHFASRSLALRASFASRHFKAARVIRFAVIYASHVIRFAVILRFARHLLRCHFALRASFASLSLALRAIIRCAVIGASRGHLCFAVGAKNLSPLRLPTLRCHLRFARHLLSLAKGVLFGYWLISCQKPRAKGKIIL